MNCKCGCKRLSSCALGVSLGIISGLVMLVVALAGMHWNYALPVITDWAEIFPGYAPTIAGGFIGLAWGFLEGFIFGVVIGWIYNICLCCCASKKCSSVDTTNTSCQP